MCQIRALYWDIEELFPILKRTSITINDRNSVKRVMDLFEWGTILHNLLLDYEDDMPDNLKVDLEEGHYWINEYTGGGDTDANGSENFDCRE